MSTERQWDCRRPIHTTELRVHTHGQAQTDSLAAMTRVASRCCGFRGSRVLFLSWFCFSLERRHIRRAPDPVFLSAFLCLVDLLQTTGAWWSNNCDVWDIRLWWCEEVSRPTAALQRWSPALPRQLENSLRHPSEVLFFASTVAVMILTPQGACPCQHEHTVTREDKHSHLNNKFITHIIQ